MVYSDVRLSFVTCDSYPRTETSYGTFIKAFQGSRRIDGVPRWHPFPDSPFPSPLPRPSSPASPLPRFLAPPIQELWEGAVGPGLWERWPASRALDLWRSCALSGELTHTSHHMRTDFRGPTRALGVLPFGMRAGVGPLKQKDCCRAANEFCV